MSARPVALVTGARRGLGRAIATALAGRGFDLVLNDLEPSAELDETATHVETAGGRAEVAVADIADLARHNGLLDQTFAAGPVACLVDNAGVSVIRRGDLLKVSAESYDRCLDVNARGTFFLTQAFARRLLQLPPQDHHRSIVIVSSANASVVSTTRGEYCVSKAALAMVAKLFAVRLAEAGIGVYEIRPGVIATEMTQPSKARYDRFFAEGRNPMPRWGRPDEVGRAAAACACGDLPYTVAQPLMIDGGLWLSRL